MYTAGFSKGKETHRYQYCHCFRCFHYFHYFRYFRYFHCWLLNSPICIPLALIPKIVVKDVAMMLRWFAGSEIHQ